MSDDITVAIKALISELKADKSKYSYYYTWQANMAMAIKDSIKDVSHEDANAAAILFLERFIGDASDE